MEVRIRTAQEGKVILTWSKSYQGQYPSYENPEESRKKAGGLWKILGVFSCSNSSRELVDICHLALLFDFYPFFSIISLVLSFI